MLQIGTTREPDLDDIELGHVGYRFCGCLTR